MSAVLCLFGPIAALLRIQYGHVFEGDDEAIAAIAVTLAAIGNFKLFLAVSWGHGWFGITIEDNPEAGASLKLSFGKEPGKDPYASIFIRVKNSKRVCNTYCRHQNVFSVQKYRDGWWAMSLDKPASADSPALHVDITTEEDGKMPAAASKV